MQTKKHVGVLALVLSGLFTFVSCGGSSSGSSSTPTTCQNYTATETAPVLWTELNPSGTAPDKRMVSASAYDATNDRLIVFGGKDTSTTYSDTWVLSNASGTSGTPAWTALSTSGTTPPQRARSIGAYNSTDNVFFIFGGVDENNSVKMDLWKLTDANGVSGTPTWSNPAIGGTAPSSRVSMRGVYDETTDTLIFFGGNVCGSSTCTLYQDTWTITNLSTNPTWVQLNPTGTLPSARFFHSAVYDATNNRMIIFGGNTSTALSPSATSNMDDTWVLTHANGTGGTPAWSQLNLSTSAKPSAREGHTAVYDSDNDRMIVYAGVNIGDIVQSDVWILSDSLTSPKWVQYNTGATNPDARAYQNAAYTGDTKNRMVMFGGSLGGSNYGNDAWVLQNANGKTTSAVSSVVISQSSTTVCAGNTDQLIATAYDAAGIEITGVIYEWSSSNTSIARVDYTGLVTGVAEGTVIITVTVDGVSQEITLTITASSSSGGGGGGYDCSEEYVKFDHCGEEYEGSVWYGGLVHDYCDCPSDTTTYAGMDNLSEGGPYKICTCK